MSLAPHFDWRDRRRSHSAREAITQTPEIYIHLILLHHLESPGSTRSTHNAHNRRRKWDLMMTSEAATGDPYMMTHLHPLTASSRPPAEFRPVRDRSGLAFLGSATRDQLRAQVISEKGGAPKTRGGELCSPSSARMEKERTEMWMTVGAFGVSAVGRLLPRRGGRC